MVAPDSQAELLTIAHTPPLGVLPEIDPQSTRSRVVDGTTIVLYTDGLVERRGEIITDGIERLRSAIRSEDPERLCGHVMDSMIGQYVPDDDVALLALRVRLPWVGEEPTVARNPDVPIARSELFACHPASVKAGRRFIAECVKQLGLHSLPDIQLMVSELSTNAILHSGSEFDITVERVDETGVRIEVRDFGQGVPRFFNRGVDAERGRGLQIVDLLADTWGVNNRPGGRGKSTWFVVSSRN
jgi:anti-sigma regulatory factor (Ser/Thr protein kinase)